ncbi:hypothetical protein V6N13_130199 [Hibiscus sabdariffa]
MNVVAALGVGKEDTLMLADLHTRPLGRVVAATALVSEPLPTVNQMKNQDEFHCAMEDMLPTGTSRLETHISHRHKMILMSLRPMNNTAVNREILKYLHDQVK